MRLADRFPVKLNLRGIAFDVKQVKTIDPKTVENCDPETEVVLGAYDWKTSTIEVVRDIPNERKQVTLLHEILHALTEDMDIDDPDIDRLAWRLYDVITRNGLVFGS